VEEQDGCNAVHNLSRVSLPFGDGEIGETHENGNVAMHFLLSLPKSIHLFRMLSRLQHDDASFLFSILPISNPKHSRLQASSRASQARSTPTLSLSAWTTLNTSTKMKSHNPLCHYMISCSPCLCECV